MPVHFSNYNTGETASQDFDPTKQCIVFGAVLCEEGAQNNLTLSFFTSTYRKGKTRPNFPQEEEKVGSIMNLLEALSDE